ncbi:unnamed protein product [Mycena citricolor]|uniref:Glyoxalase-like domain-containing protein n=1 Tax=Mycena citricolor TaxID=2018698 RepID=A0AAD2Q5Q8_9AGAR|nr:unnamed protein product [Mycena citricolor]
MKSTLTFSSNPQGAVRNYERKHKTLDHIVHLSPPGTVHENAAQWRELGFNVIEGGVHADGLTENTLVILSDHIYFELIAFTKPVDAYPPGSPIRKAREEHKWASCPPGWIDYAFLGNGSLVPPGRISDVINSRAGGEKLYVDEVPGGRTRPDGQVLKWVISSAAKKASLLPFFCGDVTDRALRVSTYQTGEQYAAAIGAQGIAHILLLTDSEPGFWQALKEISAVVDSQPQTGHATKATWTLANPSAQGKRAPSLILALSEVGLWVAEGEKAGTIWPPYARIVLSCRIRDMPSSTPCFVIGDFSIIGSIWLRAAKSTMRRWTERAAMVKPWMLIPPKTRGRLGMEKLSWLTDGMKLVVTIKWSSGRMFLNWVRAWVPWNSDAPNRAASSRFDPELEKITTSAPIFAANMTAKCPSPPISVPARRSRRRRDAAWAGCCSSRSPRTHRAAAHQGAACSGARFAGSGRGTATPDSVRAERALVEAVHAVHLVRSHLPHVLWTVSLSDDIANAQRRHVRANLLDDTDSFVLQRHVCVLVVLVGAADAGMRDADQDWTPVGLSRELVASTMPSAFESLRTVNSTFMLVVKVVAVVVVLVLVEKDVAARLVTVGPF